MNHILISILLLIFAFSVASADYTDLSQMDYDSLAALKLAVDAELHTRPESASFELSPGIYTVGIDIKPGRYYIAASKPEKTTLIISVYENAEKYSSRSSGNKVGRLYEAVLNVGEPAKSINLNDGNIILISATLKMRSVEFTPDDYYTYIAPSGTYVPAGKYIVGADIPPGTYRVYAATLNTGRMTIYNDSSTTTHTNLSDSLDIIISTEPIYETALLANGNYVVIEVDIVMSKQPSLQFE